MARPRSVQTATQAVEAAVEAGEDVYMSEKDGKTVAQRPLDINAPIVQEQAKGERIKVLNRINATVFMTDCKIGPGEEGMILRSDYDNPKVRKMVVAIADVD